MTTEGLVHYHWLEMGFIPWLTPVALSDLLPALIG